MTGQASLVAATGAVVCESMMSMGAYVLSNKLSTGFKALTLEVGSMVAQNTSNGTAGTPTTAAGDLSASTPTLGVGAKVIGQTRNMQQGVARITNNPLNLMLEGRGFFVVTAADGTRYYTRDGNFKTDGTGKLVTSKGYVVSPSITIPNGGTDIKISEAGVVTANVNNVVQTVGTLDIAVFSNDSGLKEVGGNMYMQVDPIDNPVIGQATTQGRGAVIQGALEDSNVQIVTELINVMQANTAFGLLMKIIEADRKNGDAIAAAA